MRFSVEAPDFGPGKRAFQARETAGARIQMGFSPGDARDESHELIRVHSRVFAANVFGFFQV